MSELRAGKSHPSENPQFFERPPEAGTAEFEEAKNKAGVESWPAAFSRRIENAQSNGDKLLLENSVRAMEEEVSRLVKRAIDKGDTKAARSFIDSFEKFAEERHLDIGELLQSQRERIADEKLKELEELGKPGVMDLAGRLLRSDERQFDKTDIDIIFQLMKTLLKEGRCETVEDALVEASIKRYQARPGKTLYVAVGKRDDVVSVGTSAIKAALKFNRESGKS